MAAESETERVGVRTYVPRYQKSEWERDAEELDMSRSEFVRTMVQAGRRSFDFDGSAPEDEDNHEQAPEGDATPGVGDLESRLLDLLESGDHYSWEELVAGLTDDIEERLDETLTELQNRNRVRYSGRHGGYTVVSDGE